MENTAISADKLVKKKLPGVRFAVEGLIPIGLSILAGAPKSGKSILGMMMALCVANGGMLFGSMETHRCRVLYISLEDGMNRIQGRLKKMSKHFAASGRLFVSTVWQGDNGSISRYLKQNQGIGLVFIDTYSRFTGSGRRSGYQADYRNAGELKMIADYWKVAIVLVHHTIKNVPRDWVTGLYGSSGLTGAADSVLYLERDRGKRYSRLHLTGRDVEEGSFRLVFETDSLIWKLKNNRPEVQLTAERQKIYTILKEAKNPIELSEIMKRSGKSKTAANNLLKKMVGMGVVEKVKHGQYKIGGF